MSFYYSEEGKVKIDMKDYVQDVLEDIPIKLEKINIAVTPAGETYLKEARARHYCLQGY